jgi:uroporphyrinogen-III synthase
MRVLLTRPAEDSRAIARILEAEGVTCLVWPLTRIAPAAALAVPPGIQALLFTSANGVRAFAALSGRRDLPALCVGEATAEAAREAGFGEVRSAGGDARALAGLARETGFGRFLHLRGRDAAGDLAGSLRACGREVAEAVVYEAREGGPAPAAVAEALARGTIDLVTVWSPRHAAILARRLAQMPARLTATDLLAISPAAALPLEGAGFRRAIVARAPGRAAMLEALRARARAGA